MSLTFPHPICPLLSPCSYSANVDKAAASFKHYTDAMKTQYEATTMDLCRRMEVREKGRHCDSLHRERGRSRKRESERTVRFYCTHREGQGEGNCRIIMRAWADRVQRYTHNHERDTLVGSNNEAGRSLLDPNGGPLALFLTLQWYTSRCFAGCLALQYTRQQTPALHLVFHFPRVSRAYF